MLMLEYRVKNQHKYTKKKPLVKMVVKENQDNISVKYFTNRCIGQAANKLKCRLRNPGSILGWVFN